SLRVQPDNDWVRLSLADALMTLSESAEARTHYELLRERRPADADVLRGLGRSLRLLQEFNASQGVLEEALRVAPKEPRTLAELGKLELDLDKPVEAEKWLLEALRLAPKE